METSDEDNDQETSKEAMDTSEDSRQKTLKQVKKKKSHKCKLCGKSLPGFSSGRKANLVRHIRCFHEGSKEYGCDTCHKFFSEKGSLQKHIKSVHEKIKDHKCQFCDKSFFHRGHLKDHIKCVHKKIKDHTCQVCDKSFGRSDSLKRHVETIHNHDGVDQSPSLKCKKQVDAAHKRSKNSKRHNDHEDENLMMINEYESLKKDKIGGLLQNQDEKFNAFKELFQQEMDKKLDELKELFQQKIEDLKKEQIVNNKQYENEIAVLKKEVVELQQQLQTKAATKQISDNPSLEPEINPNDYQFNHECMVKEEIIGQNKDVQSELRVVKEEITEENGPM